MKQNMRAASVDRRVILSTFAVLPLLRSTVAFAQDAGSPLPSWNDGPAKQAIIDFVRVTTDRSSPKFVPVPERLAVFDQDGTLWVEHPM